jgi:ParB family chromosome partitioning protein
VEGGSTQRVVDCSVKPERGASADRLAAAVALDMAQWWQPTVAGYLGRVSKPLICEAVTEAKGSGGGKSRRTQERRHGRPRRKIAHRTGWLPAMLRGA